MDISFSLFHVLRALSRNLRYALCAHELADRVLQAGPSSTPYVTWDVVLKLADLSEPERNDIKPKSAGPTASAARKTEATVETSQQKRNDRTEESTDNMRAQLRSDNVSSYVDSGDRQANSSQYDSGSRKSGNNVQENSQPRTPVEVATAMFHRIDRDGNGVVTHIELIKALRGDRKVAAVRICSLLHLESF